MAKRKTKRAARSEAKPRRRPLLEGWWGKMSPQGRRRVFMALVHLILLGLLGGGAYYGLTTADQYVHRLDRYQGHPEVVLANEPEWLGRCGQVREQILNEADAEVRAVERESSRSGQPEWFNPTLAARVADRLAKRFGAVPAEPGSAPLANACVARVVQVDKQLAGPENPDDSAFTRRIVVTLEFRKPLAQIRFGVGQFSPVYCILDNQAHVLEERLVAAGDLPEITGFARGLPRVYVGRKLDARDIQAGLDLAHRLSSEPYFGEISQLDVSNYGRKDPMASELVIVARAPASMPGASPQRIGWGVRLDSPDFPIESNDRKIKLALLLGVWTKNNTLNLMSGPYNLWQTRDMLRFESQGSVASSNNR